MPQLPPLCMALKKALYKLATFFKGVLLPLCELGTCMLHEALIIGNVLAKNSIPMLHLSAALLKIAEMDYIHRSKQHLPPNTSQEEVCPAVQSHRCRRVSLPRVQERFSDSIYIPVLWHQSLLMLVQRYIQRGLVCSAEGGHFRASPLQVPPRYHSLGEEIDRQLEMSGSRCAFYQ